MSFSAGNANVKGHHTNGEASIQARQNNANNGYQHAALLPTGAAMDPATVFHYMQAAAMNSLPTLLPAKAQPGAGAGMDANQQMLWQQAFQQLTAGTNLSALATPPSLQRMLLNSNNVQPFILPASATNINTAQQQPAMPPMHFFQAALGQQQPQILAAAAAAGQGVPGGDGTAPVDPSQQPSIEFNVGRKRAAQAVSKEKRKSRNMEPAFVISSYSHLSSSALSVHSDDGDFVNDPNVDYSKMTPAQRRRNERNQREQQRSYRISQQIKQLREVLTESNVPFKPNKFAILVSVGDYLKQLQRRSVMLDAEHQKLSDTLRETNELISSGQIPASVDVPSTDSLSDTSADELFVQGLDYTCIVDHCPFAIGVAALDGRVLACNDAFEKLIGSSKEEMCRHSLFMFIRNHQDLFEAMADLLKKSSAATEAGDGILTEPSLFYWCGHIVSLASTKVSLLVAV